MCRVLGVQPLSCTLGAAEVAAKGVLGWRWGSQMKVGVLDGSGGPRWKWGSWMEAQELFPCRTWLPFFLWGTEGALGLVSSRRGRILSLGTGGGGSGKGPRWHSLGSIRVGAGGSGAPVPLSPARLGSEQDLVAPSGKAWPPGLCHLPSWAAAARDGNRHRHPVPELKNNPNSVPSLKITQPRSRQRAQSWGRHAPGAGTAGASNPPGCAELPAGSGCAQGGGSALLLLKPQTSPRDQGSARRFPSGGTGRSWAPKGKPQRLRGHGVGTRGGRPRALWSRSLPLRCRPWGEHARRVRAGRSPGQALTKPGAARDMPGGLHTSWNRFQPLRLPMLHFAPAKPVAPVAGAGAGPILSLHPIAGAWKRLFHPWDLERGELPGACRARAGGITAALGHPVFGSLRSPRSPPPSTGGCGGLVWTTAGLAPAVATATVPGWGPQPRHVGDNTGTRTGGRAPTPWDAPAPRPQALARAHGVLPFLQPSQ